MIIRQNSDKKQNLEANRLILTDEGRKKLPDFVRQHTDDQSNRNLPNIYRKSHLLRSGKWQRNALVDFGQKMEKGKSKDFEKFYFKRGYTKGRSKQVDLNRPSYTDRNAGHREWSPWDKQKYISKTLDEVQSLVLQNSMKKRHRAPSSPKYSIFQDTYFLYTTKQILELTDRNRPREKIKKLNLKKEEEHLKLKQKIQKILNHRKMKQQAEEIIKQKESKKDVSNIFKRANCILKNYDIKKSKSKANLLKQRRLYDFRNNSSEKNWNWEGNRSNLRKRSRNPRKENIGLIKPFIMPKNLMAKVSDQ